MSDNYKQMDRPSVVIAGKVLPIVRQLLEDAAQVTYLENPHAEQGEALRQALAKADGLLSTAAITVNERLLAQAPGLKVVSQPSVGIDNIDLAACSRRNIPVGNTPGVLVEATADLCFGLLLGAARRIPAGWDFVRSGAWERKEGFGFGVDLYGKTLGIMGMGSIGAAVAKRAQASGMSVLYHNRRPRPDDKELGAFYAKFDELLAKADFLLLLVPLTAASEHLLGAREFGKMKPTAYLINAARGKIVDTQALYEALQHKQIAFAALDVTEPEPLPGDHPLLQLDNILITPHIGSATHETRDAMARLAVENLLNGLGQKPLPACANPEVNFS